MRASVGRYLILPDDCRDDNPGLRSGGGSSGAPRTSLELGFELSALARKIYARIQAQAVYLADDRSTVDLQRFHMRPRD